MEAIREFRILTHSYSAEYGRNSGGVFSSVTRSGTNEFHGSVYEFVRNDIFDARNFFHAADLPPFRRNQFGASFGGPVFQDRVFFFANYEGIRERQLNACVASVPDDNARNGLLPDANEVLRPVGPGLNNGINPAVLPFLNLLPRANGPNLGGGIARLFSNLSTKTTEDYSMARVDFHLSDQDNLYYRLVYDPSNTQSDTVILPFFGGSDVTYQYHVLSNTHIFSPTSLNEFRFAFNRTDPRSTTGPLEIAGIPPFAGLGFGTIQFSASAIPTGQASTAALTTFGNGVGAPRRFLHNLFQVTDTFSHVRGAHSFKFGVDVQRLQANYRNTPFPGINGIYSFPSLERFLLGTPSQVQFPLIGGDSSPIRGWRQTVLGWFVQDDYRLRPNLTLNLGLRHEFVTAPIEVNGRNANLPSLTAKDSIIGPAYPTTKNNFGPRVGLAWDPTGSGKTSVRAGFGLFYNLPIMGRLWDTSILDYRFATTIQVNNPLNFPKALLSGFTLGTQATRDVQSDLQTPTSVHWNLEIGRQLTPSMSVQIGYVASKQYHLEHGPQANRFVGAVLGGAERLPDGRKFFRPGLPRINPNFTSIQWVDTPGWGRYNALQLGFQRRLSRGLQLQAGYTWSKNTSTVDQQFGAEVQGQVVGPMDLDDLAPDYAISNFHQSHVLTVNGKYQMPWDRLLTSGVAKTVLGGWEINSIWRATSGLPQVVAAGFNVSRSGDPLASDRPNLNPGFSNSPNEGVSAGCPGIAAGQKLGTPDRFFDPCAFSLPEAGTYGNLGRNTLIGPDLFNVNFGAVKNTPLPWREGMNLEFRLEVFNLFNHANFRLPAAALFTSSGSRNANAGRITQTATDNRDLQFGMKLTF